MLKATADANSCVKSKAEPVAESEQVLKLKAKVSLRVDLRQYVRT